MKKLTRITILNFYNNGQIGERGVDVTKYDLNNIAPNLKCYSDIVQTMKIELRDIKLRELGL
jgi:hypothetical protein